MSKEVTLQKVREFLPKVRVFAGLTPIEICVFVGMAEEMRVDEDSLIIKEGSQADSFYVIYAGEVEVTRDDGTDLGTLEDGDVFGEVSLVFSKPRSANITTLESTILLRFSYADYKALEQSFPQVAKKIHNNVAKVIAQRSWSN